MDFNVGNSKEKIGRRKSERNERGEIMIDHIAIVGLRNRLQSLVDEKGFTVDQGVLFKSISETIKVLDNFEELQRNLEAENAELRKTVVNLAAKLVNG